MMSFKSLEEVVVTVKTRHSLFASIVVNTTLSQCRSILKENGHLGELKLILLINKIVKGQELSKGTVGQRKPVQTQGIVYTHTHLRNK